MEPCFYCLTSRVNTQYVTRHQQILCLLTKITKLHTAPGAEIQDGPCARLWNQAQFYYGHHTNCNLNSQTAVALSQSQDRHTQPAWKQTRSPQAPKQKWQGAFWTGSVSPGTDMMSSWHIRDLTLKPDLQKPKFGTFWKHTEQWQVLRVQS